MKLIAGIGNPSHKYELTRHNAGFMALDRVSSASGIGLNRNKHSSLFGRGVYCGQDVVLVRPLTYVNLSGRAVRSFIKYYPLQPEDMFIMHDDMDIPLGRIKIKKAGSSAGHGGVGSIIRDLGTDAFPRLRIGIGSEARKGRGAGFVLGRFTPEERDALDGVLKRCVGAVEEFLANGLESAMNRFN